jgi:hypothetical protein
MLFRRRVEQERIQQRVDEVQRLRYRVSSALEEFRNDKRCVMSLSHPCNLNSRLCIRLKVLEPYRPTFEKAMEDASVDTGTYVMPPHQYLFHCYVYQFHLVQFSGVVVQMVSVHRLLLFRFAVLPRCSNFWFHCSLNIHPDTDFL